MHLIESMKQVATIDADTMQLSSSIAAAYRYIIYLYKVVKIQHMGTLVVILNNIQTKTNFKRKCIPTNIRYNNDNKNIYRGWPQSLLSAFLEGPLKCLIIL